MENDGRINVVALVRRRAVLNIVFAVETNHGIPSWWKDCWFLGARN